VVSLDDRLLRGTLAGLIAGLFIVLVNNTSYYLLHFSKALWVQMLSELSFGHAARNTIEHVLGFILFFIVAGALGYIFAWLIAPRVGEGNYPFRAVGLGLGFWLATNVLGTLYRVPMVHKMAWETAATNLVSVIGWGLIMGYIMKRWDKTYRSR
jgi:hypothetical protein